MAVRDFNGTSDVIKFIAPTYWGTTPHTIAAVTNRDVNTGAHGIFSIVSSLTDPSVTFEYTSGSGASGKIEYAWSPNGFARSTDTAWSATGAWRLAVVSVDNSTGTLIRFHAFDGTTWLHESYDDILGNFDTHSPANWTGLSPELHIGNWNDSFNWFDGKIAMAALNVGTSMSDLAVEALAGGGLSNYVSAGFDNLWELNQTSTATPVPDLIGSLPQTAISGTSVVTANDPPGTIYNFTPTPPSIVIIRSRSMRV